ncbi:MAG: ribonuclease R [Clostridia bacterium]
MDRKEKLASFIESELYVPMTMDDISHVLAVPKEDKPQLLKILDELESDGVVILTKKRKYVSCKKGGYIVTEFAGSGKEYGFARMENGEDLFIPPDKTKGAIDGDRVLIRPVGKGKDGKSGECEVVKIIKRNTLRFVGTYKQDKYYGTVKADNARIGSLFMVTQEDSLGALNNQKVLCEIERYPSSDYYAVAKVIEILGFPEDFGVDVLSVVYNYGFEIPFPEDVLREIENIPDEVSEIEPGRLDLTDKIIFTIDGIDTKDIDDAVSVEKVGDLWRLGVHIADVSNYVKIGSALDKEALKRGTSVYLADRVIPMLPPKLSNGICSLNEGVLRNAMSVFMDINKKGQVVSYSFAKSVIKSCKKATYDDVFAIMNEDADEVLTEEYCSLIPSIYEMKKLFFVLKEASKRRGNVDFDMPEAKIVVDDNGEVSDIVLRERNMAHMMIEEFMVITNSTVAEHMVKSNLPSIYRVHEAPDGDKLESFKNFVLTLGINPPTGELTPLKLQAFLESIKDRKEFFIVSQVALRSMQKAKYLNENLGHYGLALGYYTHFTSPIRRYPDLMFHRSLKAAIEQDGKTIKYIKSTNKEAALISSEREISAERCERDVNDIKKAQWMKKHIGEEFDGVISSVTSFGFFVMLPNTVEGLVRIENMTGDRFEYDEKSLTIRGTKKSYRLGEEIRITVVGVNEAQGQIDFMPEGMDYGEKQKTTGTEQNRKTRVLHRGNNRSRNRTVRNRGKKRPSRKGKS